MSKPSKKKIADDQRQETHFFNMCCDGNELKMNDLKQEESGKNEPKKGPLQTENERGTFWTVCSYCCYLYEYEKKYKECCLLCQNCRNRFHAVAVAAPPGGLLVKGKEGGYYSGYGSFQSGYSGNIVLGDKKEVSAGDTGKKRDVVEISDDSDAEKKEMDVKNEAGKVKVEGLNNGEGRSDAQKKEVDVRNEAGKVKVEGLNNGEGRGVMKRVKSVPRNTKKLAGRGVKGKKVEKVSVVEMNVEFGNGVADGDLGSDGGIRLGSGSDQNGCNEDELEFFEGDDDIFVGLRDIC